MGGWSVGVSVFGWFDCGAPVLTDHRALPDPPSTIANDKGRLSSDMIQKMYEKRGKGVTTANHGRRLPP